MSIRASFENNLEADRFSMGQLHSLVWENLEQMLERECVNNIKSLLGTSQYKDLSFSMLRNIFLIELVKEPKIDSTKFRVRWCSQLSDDPRFCSYEECTLLFIRLMNLLPTWLEDPNHLNVLNLSFSNGIIPYEIPLDYQQRIVTGDRIHTLDNLVWHFDDLYLRTLKLRKYLTSASSPDPTFFKTLLDEKIKIKTYLTDRVLTGNHKTNREKRWETHPCSVHFAERRTCVEIEYALTTQICSFDGFPADFLEHLIADEIIPEINNIAVCPITGFKLSYEKFHDDLINPTHGKSDFQVGHLDPLKLEPLSFVTGHNAANISWISANGNRIQGSLQLSAVRNLIKDIAYNYNILGW